MRRIRMCLAALLTAGLLADSTFSQDGTSAFTSPLVRDATRSVQYGIALRLDAARLNALRDVSELQLTDFAVDADRALTLDLRRMEIFASDAQLVASDGTREWPLPRPDVVLLAGAVAGEPDSSVFLSLSGSAAHGWADYSGGRFVVSSGPHGYDGPVVCYDRSRVPPEAIPLQPWECGADEFTLGPVGALPPVQREPGGESTRATCRRARFAVETDREFTSALFGGDLNAASAYVATLSGAVSYIYEMDFNVGLIVSYVRLWETDADPWDQPDTGSQLTQFQNYWNANMRGINRNVTHFYSGRPLGGGVAYVPGLCNWNYNYGLSANLGGYFPLPLQDHQGQNWDPYVVAHETGHNFGAPHTHDMTPPVDGCAWGECTTDGTIMSYCHGCPGGVANIIMHMHPRTINEAILPYVNSLACDLTYDGVSIVNFPVGAFPVCPGGAHTMTVLAVGEGTLSYQWWHNYVAIPGATGPSYTISDFDAADGGIYQVSVSNMCGNVISDPHALYPDDSLLPVSITSQPQDTYACLGEAVTLSVSAAGTAPLFYQWYRQGVAIPGAGSASYAIAALAPGDLGYYHVVVTNYCGSRTSDDALLVYPSPVPGDLNGDTRVDTLDLSQLLVNFGAASGQTFSSGDMDGDGDVDLIDLSILLQNFGVDCY